MLKIKNLVCGYSSGFVLKGINFEVRRKEFLGIVGPNGSGKTTLLKTITKLLRPTRGQILLDGIDIERMSFKELAKKIAVVPQAINMEFGINVEEFVLLGRTPHRKALQFLETKTDEEIAQEAMRLTETDRLRERMLENLSGGERQLVAIARALTQQPQLI
ncbi:MAG TPA: ABC transporter ATP-binding protein, partial [Candidatus Omnitrophica bacterium]|nr:ABC transporter ATP-binding protein [Candidatus Omnitrophota bacterium]